MSAIPITDDNFRIVYADGTEVDMARDLSVLVRSFQVESPNPTVYRQKIKGRPGALTVGRDLNERKITAVCEFFAKDSYDYHLLRIELFFALFKDGEFALVQEALPRRKWTVNIDESFVPDRVGTSGAFAIVFTCASGYAESIGSLLDPLTFDEGMWQFDQGVPYEDFSYSHTEPEFAIWNLGHREVDPRHAMLKITFRGASDKLAIKNATTGDEWKYNGMTTAGDTILLDGVFSRKNGLSIFGETNGNLLTIASGKNEFTITGTSGSFEITFDFRFLYF